jgi:hypothetical protein
MSISPLEFVQWLDNTPWSVALREGDWSFALLETVHIIGLAGSVGLIMWVDLRLLGLTMRHKPVSAVVKMLEPCAIAGFCIMFLSGALLLLSEPLKCYTTIAFRIKVVLLLFAGLNVWYFHSKVSGDMLDWDNAEVMPWRAKLVGFLSLTLWFGIIVAGRWTAYF